LAQLATAIGQPLLNDRKALYCQGLNDIGLTPLRFAFDRALHNLGEFLPSIAQLREWAEEWRPADRTPVILARPEKPDDLTDEKRKELAGRLIASMRAGIASGALAMPTYRENAEQRAAERNGLTKVPKDPKERAAWATGQAKRQGWME
jgi:hypothetical protein